MSEQADDALVLTWPSGRFQLACQVGVRRGPSGDEREGRQQRQQAHDRGRATGVSGFSVLGTRGSTGSGSARPPGWVTPRQLSVVQPV